MASLREQSELRFGVVPARGVARGDAACSQITVAGNLVNIAFSDRIPVTFCAGELEMT